MTRSSGEILDTFVEVHQDASPLYVDIDPAEGAPHEWIADAFGFGSLELAGRSAHPAGLARDFWSSERQVWLRVFRPADGGWETEQGAIEVDHISPSFARLSIAGEPGPSMIQIGGPGTPWVLVVIPPRFPTTALIVAGITDDSLFGASPDLFSW